jgi:hypothetical protein
MPSAEDNMLLYRLTQVVVLAVLSPFWYPVAKAMWREVQAALMPEGGLFGRAPTELELRRLQDRLGDFDDPLVSEPWSDRLRPQARRDARDSGADRRGSAVRSGARNGGRAQASAGRGRGASGGFQRGRR